MCHNLYMDYDLTHRNGKPYVMIPLHEYRAMAKDGLFVAKGTSPADDLPPDILEALEVRQDHPIKILRKYRGLTQHDLAAQAKISRPFLTEIETGKKNGSIQALKKIAQALNVSVDIVVA